VLRELIEKAVRRSGVVLLDLCGGGALGATLAITGAGKPWASFSCNLAFLISLYLSSLPQPFKPYRDRGL
jgi:H+/gluconate symporter-like permease